LSEIDFHISRTDTQVQNLKSIEMGVNLWTDATLHNKKIELSNEISRLTDEFEEFKNNGNEDGKLVIAVHSLQELLKNFKDILTNQEQEDQEDQQNQGKLLSKNISTQALELRNKRETFLTQSNNLDQRSDAVANQYNALISPETTYDKIKKIWRKVTT